MILREFPSYQSIRGEFYVYSVRDGVYVARNFGASFIFCRGLRVWVLTVQRSVNCTCGERDGNIVGTHTRRSTHAPKYSCVMLFCLCVS